MEVFMKVLLTAINAKYIHSNLAVYSLRAYAGKYAQQTEIAEYTIREIFTKVTMKECTVLHVNLSSQNHSL